jgi:3-hydroxyacyl-[acyl-carrier-protein] dehydratase
LIDRVLYLEKHTRISATKNVALSEDFFTDHFPGRPIMPGALQIEALAQAGTVLLEASTGLTRKALLIMVGAAKFRSFVKPGDQLTVNCAVLSSDGDIARLSGEILVGNKVVTDATLTFALKPFEEFYDSRLHQFAGMLYSNLLEDAELVNIEAKEFR